MNFMLLFSFITFCLSEPTSLSCGETMTCTKETINGETIITIGPKETDMKIPMNCDKLPSMGTYHEVIIKKGITTICQQAFTGFRRTLKKLTLPSTVKIIGKKAFYNQNSLTTIEFKEDGVDVNSAVLVIEDEAFSHCSSVTDWEVFSSVVSVGNSAFKGCTKMAGFKFSNVQTIGDDAFNSCGLKQVNLPATVTSIGVGAFSGCTSMTTISVGEGSPFSVEKGMLIGKAEDKIQVLSYPSANTQTEVVIPDNVEIISSYVFNTVPSMTKLVIGEGVTTIGLGAFTACSNLKTVKFGASVTEVGEGIFENCPNIASFEVSTNNKAFEAHDGILYQKNKRTIVKCPAKKVFTGDTYTIDDANIYVIYNRAFEGVELPANLIISAPNLYAIRSYAFSSCLTLQTVQITSPVKSIGSSVFDEAGLTSATLGNSVKMVGEHMFSNIGALQTVNLGNGILSIERRAFARSGISSIVIPDSCYYIMPHAFEYSKLTQVTIGSGVVEIAKEAFKMCGLLSTITFRGSSLERIDESAFKNCRLSSIDIPASVWIIAEEAFMNNEPLSDVEYLKKTQPNYCSTTAFTETAVTTVIVPSNYEQQEFCGVKASKTGPEDTPSGEAVAFLQKNILLN